MPMEEVPNPEIKSAIAANGGNGNGNGGGGGGGGSSNSNSHNKTGMSVDEMRSVISQLAQTLPALKETLRDVKRPGPSGQR